MSTASTDPRLSGVTLRAMADADMPFLNEVYAGTRAEELAQTPWSLKTNRRAAINTLEDTVAAGLALPRHHLRTEATGGALVRVSDDYFATVVDGCTVGAQGGGRFLVGLDPECDLIAFGVGGP